MAKLKTREQRLLKLFLVLLLLAASWYLYQFYNTRRSSALELAHQLHLQEVEMESLLEQRDKWTKRSEWLDAYQPKFTSRDQVDNELLDEARAQGIEGVQTSGFTLLEPIETSTYIQAGVAFTAFGSLPDVFSWLHELQRPETFRVIRTLRVIPNKDDPSKVNCEVELLRWYQPKRDETHKLGMSK